MRPLKALNQRLDIRLVESRREPMRTMLPATTAVLGIGIGYGEMDCVVEARGLIRQRALVETRRLVATLSRPKVMFTLTSSGYCAIHSLVTHEFSIYVFLGGLAFGAIAAMVVAWLSSRLSSSSV
jgi:hypothetical protein